MTEPLPDAPATARNRAPILAVLRDHLRDAGDVLEIGSGTGQHAVHFAAALPHLRWHTSDLPAQHAAIAAWLGEAGLPNVLPPLALDAGDAAGWPAHRYDAVFTANTLHIMGWSDVEALFSHLPRVLAADARVIVYGPFKRGGRHTAASNEAFDAQLRAADPRRGVRDLDDVQALAARAGLALSDDVAMPANNRCIVWRAIG